jgi:hypothetical protein
LQDESVVETVSMQAVRSPAPTAQVMFVAESFCPTFKRHDRTIEGRTPPAVLDQNVWPASAARITRYVDLGAPLVSAAGGRIGNTGMLPLQSAAW